jgi:TolA-binding protein
MSSNKQHSPQHAELLKKQSLEQQEVKEVLNFIRRYAKPTAIIIIAVCAFFLVDRYFKSSRIQKEIKADAALVQAVSAYDYQAILDDYGSTPSAPLALMGLALETFNAGQYDEADALYGKFLKKYGKHEMAVLAEFNQITCREAKGQLGEAHLLYGEFVNKHRDSYIAPLAMIAQARCLESLSLPADAKQVYEDLVFSYPGSSWAQMAEANLTVLESKLK